MSGLSLRDPQTSHLGRQGAELGRRLEALPLAVPSRQHVEMAPARVEELIRQLHNSQRAAQDSLSRFYARGDALTDTPKYEIALLCLQICKAGKIKAADIAILGRWCAELDWAALGRARQAHQQLAAGLGDRATVASHGRQDCVGVEGFSHVSLAQIAEELDALTAAYAPFEAAR
jgi:hypothetical protein